jgi:hypothetical protein
MTHNGWPNRATWNVNLQATNDRNCHEILKRTAADYGYFTEPLVLQVIREAFPNGVPDAKPGDMKKLVHKVLATHWTNVYGKAKYRSPTLLEEHSRGKD